MKPKPSRRARGLRAAAALAPALLISACVVGPEYKRPEVVTPETFRSQAGPSQPESIADLPWWGVFGDPALRGLIREGLADNYDLQVAVARIEQARAQVAIVKSQAKPQLGYDLGVVGEKTVVPLETSLGTTVYSTFGGALQATWELDVWGRIHNAAAAAQANLLAQEDIRRGVMLSLVSDLATDYFQLIELDRELGVADESARVYRKTFDLFDLRYKAGKDSRLSAERAWADYQASVASIADLKKRITQQENAICILLGGYPRPITRGRPLGEQAMPATPLGATSALLQRRPDILQAEQAMIGANAEIGVAVVDFFPKVGLSALAGDFGVSLGDNLRGFGIWNAGLDVAGPIFTGGRLQAAYKARQAYWDETIAQYKKTVIGAFRETSDALIAQQMLVEQRAGLQARVEALKRSADLALTRYDAGRANYFEVLEAQQQLFPTEDALAQAQRDQLLAVVGLYKALGGGWNLTDAQWAQPPH